jgi:hypothetical protein
MTLSAGELFLAMGLPWRLDRMRGGGDASAGSSRGSSAGQAHIEDGGPSPEGGGVRQPNEESPAAVPGGHGECAGRSAGSTDASQPRPRAGDEALLTADDADLLAEGAVILERRSRAVRDALARIALEEEYHRVYRPLRDEILLMLGGRDNARFHGQVYDAAAHLPRLAGLLADYFQVLGKPEHACRLRSVDEGAVVQRYQADGKSGLALVGLRCALRLFRAGVAGASREAVERELGAVERHEQLAGAWAGIVWLGYELRPDSGTLAVVSGATRAPDRPGEPRPAWDRLKRELTYGGRRLRKYRDLAEAQTAVLDTFQELQWDEVVDSPFPPGKKGSSQLKNAIKNLNEGLEQRAIEFFADGSGTHVCWRRL